MEGKSNNSVGSNVYLDNIESTIQQINQGLLNIFYAKEEGYKFTDFDTLIKSLLSSDLAKNYPATIKKYLSVFTDLNKEVGFTITTIIEINIKKKKYTVNKIDHRGGQRGIEAKHTEEKQEFDIRPELIDYYKKNTKPKATNEIRYAITKFQHYTEAAKWAGDSILETGFFFEDYKDIFSYYGYSAPDKYYTFEKYIESLSGSDGTGTIFNKWALAISCYLLGYTIELRKENEDVLRRFGKSNIGSWKTLYEKNREVVKEGIKKVVNSNYNTENGRQKIRQDVMDILKDDPEKFLKFDTELNKTI